MQANRGFPRDHLAESEETGRHANRQEVLFSGNSLESIGGAEERESRNGPKVFRNDLGTERNECATQDPTGRIQKILPEHRKLEERNQRPHGPN